MDTMRGDLWQLLGNESLPSTSQLYDWDTVRKESLDLGDTNFTSESLTISPHTLPYGLYRVEVYHNVSYSSKYCVTTDLILVVTIEPIATLSL